MSKFYSVARGNKVGVFDSIDEVKDAIKGVPAAVFLSYPTRKEAETFLEVPLGDKMREVLPINGPSKVYIAGTVNKFSAVIVEANGEVRVISDGGELLSTPERSLIYACCVALKQCKDKVYIYTTSSYIVGCLSGWLINWEKNNWENIINKDLLKQLRELTKNRNVIVNLVRDDNKYIIKARDVIS